MDDVVSACVGLFADQADFVVGLEDSVAVVVEVAAVLVLVPVLAAAAAVDDEDMILAASKVVPGEIAVCVLGLEETNHSVVVFHADWLVIDNGTSMQGNQTSQEVNLTSSPGDVLLRLFRG